MKRLFLTVLSIFAFVNLNAQDEGTSGFTKGDVFVSGSLSFGSQKDNNFDATENLFMFMPRVGFFVSENIAVGAELGFGSTKSEVGSTVNAETSTFAIGGFGRYYFTPASDFSLFASLGLGYASVKNKAASPEFSTNAFGGTLGAGFNYFLSDNFSFEVFAGALNYTSAKADVTGAESVNSFSFGGNWNDVTVGVNYKF